MTYLVSLEEDADREAFIDDMKAEGVLFEEYKGIPRLFSIPDGYNHPSIQFCDDGDVEVKATATFKPDFTDQDWGMIRVIRRDVAFNPRYFNTAKDFRNTAVRTGAGVDLYVVDGRLVDHAEFTGRFEVIYDGVSGQISAHGNSVASCAAGNTMGVATGVYMYNCAIFTSSDTASTAVIVAGIDAAVSHYQGRAGTNRPAVLTLSVGNTTASGINTAVLAAIAAGMVVTAAAGNEGTAVNTGSANYPAASAGVICVGGSNSVDAPLYMNAMSTNYGTRLDLLAPAQNRWLARTDNFNHYILGNGTSFASPMVAGAACLMLEGHGRLANSTDVAKIRTKIIANATTGRLKQNPHPNFADLPDKILYVDPNLTFEEF